LIGNASFAPERQYLERLAADRQVKLEIHVLVPDEMLVRMYNQVIATVYTPVMEPFGFVPLESAACGTPVVGVNEAGLRETVCHGVTGLLTERNPQAIAKALERLLIDPEMASQMGAAGREQVVQRWTWADAVQGLEEHFRILLGNRGN
jgi:glycosyltransferase involved in cell wall biosynthesis